MDSAWLDRLDMGLDFDGLLAVDAAGVSSSADGLVPSLSEGGAPSAAALDAALGKAPAASAADKAADAALDALERQSTDEFFAALADDFAVPSLPTPDAAGVVPVAPAGAAAAPLPPPAFVPAYAMPAYAPVMYVPAGPGPMGVPMAMPLAPAAPAALAAAAPAPRSAPSGPPAKRQRRAAAAAAVRAAAAAADSDDDSDGEWRHDDDVAGAPAPARASGARGTAAAAAAAAAGLAVPFVDTLTREERVARYREKRARRQFKKTIRYASRKAYAEVRPRIKGRFASREEVEAWRAAERAMAAGAAAAGLGGVPAATAPLEAPGVVPVM
jgi:hypothetical protein